MVPKVRIERTSPALQAGAKTTSATRALLVNRVGIEPTLTRIKSPSLSRSATGPKKEFRRLQAHHHTTHPTLRRSYPSR